VGNYNKEGIGRKKLQKIEKKYKNE